MKRPQRSVCEKETTQVLGAREAFFNASIARESLRRGLRFRFIFTKGENFKDFAIAILTRGMNGSASFSVLR